MPEFFINGQPVSAAKGQTVMQAARAAGHFIPTFCWHPNLSVSGNCRICVVEVEGEGGGGSWMEIAWLLESGLRTGKDASNSPAATRAAAAAMARALASSSRPSAPLTSAAARLMCAKAWIIAKGMRCWPMAK